MANSKKKKRPDLKGATTTTKAVSLKISRKKDSPITWMMKLLIAEAINRGASELFLECLTTSFQPFVELNGIRQCCEIFDRSSHAKLKDQIMACFIFHSTLDIARRWKEQSGVIQIRLEDGELYRIDISLVKAPVGVHLRLQLPPRPDLVGKFPVESIVPVMSIFL